MDSYGPEFLFDGMPVGLFKAGAVPVSDGSYAYVPFRGPGDYKMQLRLRESGSARCYYIAKNQRIFFTVCACPQNGVLQLAAFQREEPGAL